MLGKKQLNWLVIVFFAIIIAVVFQQIHTSMTEQGIATGGPYDNAAAYPRAIAILIGLLLILQAAVSGFKGRSADTDADRLPIEQAYRPLALLGVFALYLGLLGVLGYHLTTTPMIVALLLVCGARPSLRIFVIAVLISFTLAYFFEAHLKVVLPGGIYGLNIPW
ncbi:tripartite tricarboxylate transporter TctB family protein [Pararhizobium sp. IMCC21322]|uniref:tripartite tricarboxylate transporter TctB family protein n=1 Tax=Pararhizobium sp. IMCC21322 TaxID=3067903 RepID=UPI002741ECF8|nr:tripartite tricarboxylate transporter TctB family protein [Pararhizobium sp. IMCC21322]